jgi:hypothetical protein
MGRPRKIRKTSDINDIDIKRLEEELANDVSRASSLDSDDDNNDIVVEDENVDSYNLNQNSDTTQGINVNDSENHQFQMPPSERPLDKDSYEDYHSYDEDIPEADPNPLEDKVKERDYTNEHAPEPQNVGQNMPPRQESVIPEPINVSAPVSDELIGAASETNNTSSVNNATVTKPKPEPKRESINPNLEDMSPAQKRKAAESTADALLLTYGNLVPIPFKKISSFNLGKLENAHLKGELDKNMIVSNDGTTVESYCKVVNEQVEQTFEITQEMKDEIRPPLIEVLMENNFALTPTQRLLMAVGGQVVQMGLTSFQFMQQNKAAMNQFKAFHKENKEAAASIAKSAESVSYKTETVRHEPVEYKTETVKYKTESHNKKSDNVEEDIPYVRENDGITVEEVEPED